MNTIYPHLSSLITALNTGLNLDHPVQVYANIEQVSIQQTPSIILIPEETQIMESIKSARSITALRMKQEWSILTILRDAGDQEVTRRLVESLGLWQSRILHVLMDRVLVSGGPIQILELPKSDSILGGAIAGKIRLTTQFVFNAE